jgi:hypothetical protein
MKMVDPGHVFELMHLDGYGAQLLRFVKRVGDGYPGNEGLGKEGTNLQEVLRACLSRLHYIDGQIHSEENVVAIMYLRRAFWALERRAAARHHRSAHFEAQAAAKPKDIEVENIPACSTCGHIYCLGHEGK